MSLEAELAGYLPRILDDAHRAWPRVRLAPELFIAHLARHWPSEASDVATGLGLLRTNDLYLACACANGDPRALEAFEAAYFPDIQPALVRATRDRSRRDEVAQELRRTLFSPRPSSAPQIALYAGRGELRNWTRAAIARVILNLVTRRPRDVPAPGELFVAMPSAAADPELAHMRDRYQAEFRRAFEAATQALSSRDRNLLRQAFVDGLNVDEIGALYNVHRATAARWVAKARSTLLSNVRKSLMTQLNLDQSEFSSVMRVLRSQLNITLVRYLS